jgi:23S rRNA pseudouridine1911/1915/1917 synthase
LGLFSLKAAPFSSLILPPYDFVKAGTALPGVRRFSGFSLETASPSQQPGMEGNSSLTHHNLPAMETAGPIPSAKRAAIPVVAEGADWLVVSKPPQLLVHPTRPGGPVTLLDLVRRLLACELASGGQVSLIHRLDRETSGLMLIAKTAGAARRFSIQMMRGQIHKEYLALVRGWPEWDARMLDAPLLRQGERQTSRIWLKQMIHADGAPARTEFAVLRRFERLTADDPARFSLVQAVPLTGRMHQIRVHLAHLGHSVVGDKIYGPDEGCYLRFIETGWTPELARALLLNRHALHAHRLGVFVDSSLPSSFILHPSSFSSPLPEDLRAFMEV